MVSEEDLAHFEKAIYLPMLLQILEKDRATIEISGFKLKGPYVKIVEGAIQLVSDDLKQTNIYMTKRNMGTYKMTSDKDFTIFIFSRSGIDDRRRYSNIRLRNRTEELMTEYFGKINLL